MSNVTASTSVNTKDERKLLIPISHVIEKLFYIPNKRGEIVPFKLNNVQQDFHDNRALRSDILKSRQMGMTSIIMAWFLIECMYRYTRAVMIAHDREHTEKLLQRCHFYLETMNGPKPSLKKANANEILFDKTHSSFYIGTAGSKGFGRSDTITHLHCSEYSFWKDPETLMAGLFQAVPHETGVVVKECTANGYGTYHHKQYMNALKGASKFKSFFYSWEVFEEYKSRTPLYGNLTEEEEGLKVEYSLTNAQLQWRREKIEELTDPTLFNQEYPLTIEEAFRVSGGSLFPNIVHTHSKKWIQRKPPHGVGSFHLLASHPVPSGNYVLGIDSSGGTGNDYSAIQILDVATLEQVATFRSNTMSPPEFAKLVVILGACYNNAYLVPESNSHGLSVISLLLNDLEPYNELWWRIYKMRNPRKSAASPLARLQNYGFKTTQTSKYKLIANLQKMLDDIIIHDEVTADQLRGFGENDVGKLSNIAGTASHDDDVIALALACEGVLREILYREEPKGEEKDAPPRIKMTEVDFDDIMSRINVHKGTEHFASQTGGNETYFNN